MGSKANESVVRGRRSRAKAKSSASERRAGAHASPSTVAEGPCGAHVLENALELRI
jgi:hypothetical protein